MKMDKPYHALSEAIYGKPWMATPEAISALQVILEDRLAGHKRTDEEIQLLIDSAGGSRIARHLQRISFASDSVDEEAPYQVINGIAIIPLMGTLFPKANMLTRSSGCTSLQEFSGNIQEALQRSDVSQVVIDCDSPGGLAQGTKDCADLLYSLRGKKPGMTFVTGCCCSAAMYVAAAFGKIVASPTATLASIGTLWPIRDTSQAHAMEGIEVHVLRSSPLKGTGTQGEKFEGARKAHLQDNVDRSGRLFEEDMAKYRGVSADFVRERFGQGGILDPGQALAVGMIDQVATWEEFFTPLVRASSPAGGTGGRSMKYSVQVRGMLLALDLIQAHDAPDEVCQAALAGLGLGESATPAQINDAIAARSKPQIPSKQDTVQKPGDDQDSLEKAATAENNRVRGLISARAEFERLGHQVEQSDFDALLADRSMSAEKAKLHWIDEMAKKSQPINTDVKATGSSYDQWLKICSEALVQRNGGKPASTPQAVQWANRRIADIAREDLRMKGIQAFGTESEVMKSWVLSCASHGGDVPLDGRPVMNAYTGAGAFPSALGGVLNVMFVGVIQSPDVTFNQWSKRLNDAPDFRPSSIFWNGGQDEFDLNMTAKEPMQADIAEESTLIMNDIYDKQFVWTPVMQANDNGALAQGVNALRKGHDMTLERMHYNLLVGGTSNLAADGQVVFSSGTITALTPAARGNIVTGGGPTAAILSSARTFGLNQVWNKLNEDGTTYKRMNTGALGTILISHHWVELAEQTLSPFAQLGESKVPITDATLNRWRGKVNPIYMPLLNEQSDVKYWYAIFDAAPFIVHVFQTGYGMGGKQTVYINLLTGAVHVKWEGRFGATYQHPQQGMQLTGT